MQYLNGLIAVTCPLYKEVKTLNVSKLYSENKGRRRRKGRGSKFG